MKIIKLEINNFRQFYGKQTIEFATGDKHSVTLIHGENNGGKTALLNALKWCLYEETTENLQDQNFLINKHALAKNVNAYSVKILLSHDNKIFEVQRRGTHTPRKNQLKVFEIGEDGCYASNEEKNPNTFINSILPKEMSDYFFYQGEGTGTLSSQNDFNHIKEAISKVLGLTVAEKTLMHLTKIRNDYIKELTSYDTTNESEKQTTLKEKLQANLELTTKSLKLRTEEQAIAESEYQSSERALARFDKSILEEKIHTRSKLNSALKVAERSLIEKKQAKLKNLPIWLSDSFCSRLAQFELDKINIDELKNSHKYTVDKRLISEILKNHECICGTAVPEESNAFKLISDLQQAAVDVNLKRRWTAVTSLHSKLAKVSPPRDIMLSALDEIEKYQDEIHGLNKDIEELTHTIVESDVEDIKKVEKQRAQSKAKNEDLLRQVTNLESEVRRLTIDLKVTDEKLLKLGLSQPKAKLYQALITSTEKISDLYKEAIESASTGVDLKILAKMRELFERVAFNGYSIKKEQGNKESYTWVIVDKDGKKVAAGNGYQAMLAISFIIALIQFSKDRANAKQHLLTPGAIAPFIADSILAFIGPDNGRELVKYISESVEQSIFMFSQAQWTESHTDKGFRHKIGKEYNLVQHTILTEDQFKGTYPTKLSVLGKEYDVVKFGSEFDKVTIEEVVLNV